MELMCFSSAAVFSLFSLVLAVRGCCLVVTVLCNDNIFLIYSFSLVLSMASDLRSRLGMMWNGTLECVIEA